ALERWNLLTRKKEASAPLAVGGRLVGLGMGSASDGPLLVGIADEGNPRRPSQVPPTRWQFHDLKTLRELPAAAGADLKSRAWRWWRTRASSTASAACSRATSRARRPTTSRWPTAPATTRRRGSGTIELQPAEGADDGLGRVLVRLAGVAAVDVQVAVN